MRKIKFRNYRKRFLVFPFYDEAVKMRKIKFRIWDEQEKKMYTGDFRREQKHIVIMLNGGICIQDGKGSSQAPAFWHKRFISMQYTGRTDRNGIEIYENDYLKYDRPGYPMASGIYLVSWCEEDLGFVCEREEPYNYLLPSVWSECEIVGNKCENKELMATK